MGDRSIIKWCSILNAFFVCSFSYAQSGVQVCRVESFGEVGALAKFTSNNESVLPNVVQNFGRYRASLMNNDNNKTLHFNSSQGRLDAWLTRFPFEYIARNIGIGTLADSQQPHPFTGSAFNFTGVQVHVPDFDSKNSSHVVVGHRNAGAVFTIEGKNTVDGVSIVNDLGSNVVPNARADIKVVGKDDGTLTIYWQLPNLSPSVQPDNWNLYKYTGQLPGAAPSYGGSGSMIYVGLITYAAGNDGLPFVGTVDSISLSESGSSPCVLTSVTIPVSNFYGLVLLGMLITNIVRGQKTNVH